jgi:hypothetical protein
MPHTAFPKPFAKLSPSQDLIPWKRIEPKELQHSARGWYLDELLRQDQAEMRKQAEHMAGEWVAMSSGVAMFIPERMFEVARGMVGTEVGAVRRDS